MTDKELDQLRSNGMQGLDLSPGNEISRLAYNYILELRQRVQKLEIEKEQRISPI